MYASKQAWLMYHDQVLLSQSLYCNFCNFFNLKFCSKSVVGDVVLRKIKKKKMKAVNSMVVVI